MAQELIEIIRLAGVTCEDVDFDWLLEQDQLVTRPPQNLHQGLEVLRRIDDLVHWVGVAL